MMNLITRSVVGFLLVLASCTIIAATALSEPKNLDQKTEQTSGKSLFDMSLEDILEMPVSTASKLATRADLAPGNIMVITQEEIRRFGYRTVAEALERVVGFLNNDGGLASAIGFRGIAPTSITSNARILYLIDGLRYNERGFDTAFINESFPLDIESIDRIEVLKGAGSAIWGTNALYAVVNVISKNADSDRNRQIMGEYASNNRGKVYASYGNSTEGGLKYWAGISGTDSDGDIEAFYPAFDDPSTNNGRDESDFGREALRGSFRASYEELYLNFLYSLDETDSNFSTSGAFDFDAPLFDKQEPTRLEVGYKLPVWEEQNGELLLRSYYGSDRIGTRSTFPGEMEGFHFVNTIRTASKTAGGEIRYSQDITDQIKGLAGVEFTRVYKHRFTSNDELRDPNGDVVPDSEFFLEQNADRTDQSYFFDFSYTPIDELAFFAGGRWDKPSDLSTAFGPRASIVAKPLEHTIVKFLYSQGNRNPSIGESQVNPNEPQSLDPEELRFYEFLIEQRIEDWASITASFFYNELDDILEAYAFEGFNVYYTNVKGFRSRGVELSGWLKFQEFVKGYFTFTYAEGRELTTYTDLKNMPEYIARSGLSFTFDDIVIASPEVVFGSSTRTDLGYRFDPYWIANLTLLSAPVTEGVEVSASIYNMFDEDFPRLMAGTGEAARAMEVGREFRLQGTWRF